MSGATMSINSKLADGTLVQVGGVGFDDLHSNLIGLFNGDAGTAEAVLEQLRLAVTPLTAGGSAQQVAAQAKANVQRAFPDAAPVQQQQAENPAAPTCVHGARVFKTGEKNGRTWKAYMCSAGQNAPDKCAPSWVK